MHTAGEALAHQSLLRGCPTGQSGAGRSSAEISSSQVTPACVTLTKTDLRKCLISVLTYRLAGSHKRHYSVFERDSFVFLKSMFSGIKKKERLQKRMGEWQDSETTLQDNRHAITWFSKHVFHTKSEP